MSFLKSEIRGLKDLFSSPASLGESIGLTKKPENAIKVSDIASLYRNPQKIKGLMDFRYFNGDESYWILGDETTYVVIFEASKTQILDYGEHAIEEARDQISNSFKSIPGFKTHPYVVQTFTNEESLGPKIGELEEYARQYGPDGAYRTEYFNAWREHLKNVSNPDGYFRDELKGTRWSANTSRTRYVVYRDMKAFSKDNFVSPGAEILTVTKEMMTQLSEAGCECKVYNPKDVYEWIVPWLNPTPEGETSGSEMVEKFPLEYAEGDYYDLSHHLWKEHPFFDVENKILKTNKAFHSVVSADKFIRSPKPGAFSRNLSNKGDHATAIQRLPQGSVISTTTVIKSGDEVEAHLDLIIKDSRGEGDRELESRDDVQKAKVALDKDQKIYPSTLNIYIQGKSEDALFQARSKAMGVLRTIGLDPISLSADLCSLDTFVRYLPASYRPEYDKHLCRARLTWDRHISNLVPLYGHGTGTGNHGFLFFNKAGELVSFDPLNKADKENNSFLGIIAPTGTGKSATMNQLIAATKAVHDPRFIVIDVMGSFKLHEAYFKELGYQTKYVEISTNSDVTLPVFQGAVEAYLDLENEDLEAEFIEDDDSIDDKGSGPVNDNKNNLERMVLTAKLMVTKGDAEEDVRFKSEDRTMLKVAILEAAKRVHKAGGKIVRPQDVVQVLNTIESEGTLGEGMRNYHQGRRERAGDMSEAIEDYTHGDKGRMFNSDKFVDWPEADFLVLDLELLQEEGFEDILYLTYVGLMNTVVTQAKKNRSSNRDIICINDEAHIINEVRTLARIKRKLFKMGRKLGLWLWDATQNIGDYPDEAIDMLNAMEWLIVLKLPKSEIESIGGLKNISSEEKQEIEKLATVKGQYVEGMVLSNTVRTVFRSVPPAWYLALGQTETDEYRRRSELMKEHKVTEIEAAHLMEKEIEEKRCNG